MNRARVTKLSALGPITTQHLRTVTQTWGFLSGETLDLALAQGLVLAVLKGLRRSEGRVFGYGDGIIRPGSVHCVGAQVDELAHFGLETGFENASDAPQVLLTSSNCLTTATAGPEAEG